MRAFSCHSCAVQLRNVLYFYEQICLELIYNCVYVFSLCCVIVFGCLLYSNDCYATTLKAGFDVKRVFTDDLQRVRVETTATENDRVSRRCEACVMTIQGGP